jgi:hypothetical protein
MIAVGLVAAPLALAGCKQGVGDRCQVQSDCDDGLICSLPPGATPQVGGMCVEASQDFGPTVTEDLSTPQDMSPATDL